MGKQSQCLLQPTEVESGLQVGVEFDNNGVNLFVPFFQKIHENETFFSNYDFCGISLQVEVILFNNMPITCSQANCELMTEEVAVNLIYMPEQEKFEHLIYRFNQNKSRPESSIVMRMPGT